MPILIDSPLDIVEQARLSAVLRKDITVAKDTALKEDDTRLVAASTLARRVALLEVLREWGHLSAHPAQKRVCLKGIPPPLRVLVE